MNLKQIFALAAAMSLPALFGAVVLEENFSKDGTLADNGYLEKVKNEKDQFNVKDGVLTTIFHHKPYKGGVYRKKLPALGKKVELSFDIKPWAEGTNGDNGSSLKIEFGNKLFMVRNGKFWSYIPGKNTWFQPGILKRNEWHTIRIVFDTENRSAEYYINDMENPVHLDTNCNFASTESYEISIGNYGIANGTLVHQLKNLKVTNIERTKEETAAAGILWEETFEKNGTIADNGYKSVSSNKKDQFNVKDGVLSMIFYHSPYKGGNFRKEVPLKRKMEFSFDVKVRAEGTDGDTMSSLKMQLGNCLITFRQGKLWFHLGKNWALPGIVKENQWHKIKIRLDADKKIVEFYINDMKNPVLIQQDFEFNPDEKPYLWIGNYGHATNTTVNHLKNLTIKEWKDDVTANFSGDLKGSLCFFGIRAADWPVQQLAEKFGNAPVVSYWLHVSFRGDKTENNFDLLPKPPIQFKTYPKCIIFADMPLTAIPDYARKNLLNALLAGADLLILNGDFTLNRGHFAGSELEQYLPVTVDNPWKTPQAKSNARKIKKNGKLAAAVCNAGKGRVIVLMTPDAGKFILNETI